MKSHSHLWLCGSLGGELRESTSRENSLDSVRQLPAIMPYASPEIAPIRYRSFSRMHHAATI
jgi:hypothetical protein